MPLNKMPFGLIDYNIRFFAFPKKANWQLEHSSTRHQLHCLRHISNVNNIFSHNCQMSKWEGNLQKKNTTI
jgi:hypothetical protein